MDLPNIIFCMISVQLSEFITLCRGLSQHPKVENVNAPDMQKTRLGNETYRPMIRTKGEQK